MKPFLSNLKIIFFLLLSSNIVIGQEATYDSLQQEILAYTWYVPKVDTLLEKLEINEANTSFLIENIGMMSDTGYDVMFPILGYLSKHPELLTIDLITEKITSNHKDLIFFLYILDFMFDDLVLYLQYLDKLIYEESSIPELKEKLIEKRGEAIYRYEKDIPFIHNDSISYMIFELKPETDLKAFNYFLQMSFPDFHKKAYRIVDINNGVGDPIICIPYEKGTIIDEKPYQEYVKRIYEIGSCAYGKLYLKYRE